MDYRAKVKYLHREPFSSDRKRMSSVVEENGNTVIYTKGASELILAECS